MVFYWESMIREMRIVLLCCCVAGMVDTIVVGRVGFKGKGLGHGVGTAVLGLVAWMLMK